MNWLRVCHLNDIEENSGVAADFGERQVALFKLFLGNSAKVFAIDNWDPLAKAAVISRGIIGSVNDEIVVFSPIYKQRYALASGRCLDDEVLSISVYPTRITGEYVEVAI